MHTELMATVLAWHGPGWWVIFFPLGWIAIILLFFALFRGRRGWGPGCGRRRWSDHTDAQQLLERRYANGELSADELRERLGVLRDVRGSATA